MKKTGIFAAVSAAASYLTVAVYSVADHRAVPPLENEGSSVPSRSKETGSGSRRDRGKDGFAPRFDGLRFIETLVTAHR